jgi:hypothetical protein
MLSSELELICNYATISLHEFLWPKGLAMHVVVRVIVGNALEHGLRLRIGLLK